MQPFDIHILNAFEDAEPIWREAEKAADLHVYQTYGWLTDWYRLVGAKSDIEPCLVVISDAAQQPLMILPLAIKRRGLWRVLVWMGAEFADYHAPILMPDASAKLQDIGVEMVWKALQQKLGSVDYADFERQPGFIGEQANPFIDQTALLCTHSAHHTDLFGDWASYYTSKRGRRTRHNDRRKRKKLEKEGKLTFITAKSQDDIDRLITAMIQQKSAYAKALGERNILEQPGYAAFLREKAQQGVKDGSMILCALDLDGDILAAQWGAVHKRRLYSIVASYGQGPHHKLSPGDMLLHDLMGWCFDNGIETFDFTYGDEPYKQPWCEHHVPLYRSLMPITALGAVRTCPLRQLIRLKRWAKSQAWLATTYAHTRKLVQGI